MQPVTITAARPRRWWMRFRAQAWKRSLPERWEDVPLARRRLYFGWLLERGEAALPAVLLHLLQLPRWAMKYITSDTITPLLPLLQWMLPKPDCEHLVFQSFTHAGVTYHYPAAKGGNISCIEWPIADEYYLEFVRTGSEPLLLMLTATLCREQDADHQRAMRRDDPRAALHSRAEVIARAEALDALPVEYQMAALLYFAGLKTYITNTYKGWIFEQPDEDNEEQNDESDDTRNDDNPDAQTQEYTESLYPDFGMWGFYQEVAEAGLFGTLNDVYQASLHDVLMWGVRQSIKAHQQRAAMSSVRKTPAYD